MQVTDVNYEFLSSLATGTATQIVATGNRVRLYSIVASGRDGIDGFSTDGTTTVTFRDGGASGDTKFAMEMGPWGDINNQWNSIVVNLPEQGILFLDGINIEADQAGLTAIAITFQGPPKS